MLSFFKKKALTHPQRIVFHIYRNGTKLNVLRKDFEFRIRILPGQTLIPEVLNIPPTSSLYRMYGYPLTAHCTNGTKDILHCEVDLLANTIPHKDIKTLEEAGWEIMQKAEVIPIKPQTS